MHVRGEGGLHVLHAAPSAERDGLGLRHQVLLLLLQGAGPDAFQGVRTVDELQLRNTDNNIWLVHKLHGVLPGGLQLLRELELGHRDQRVRVRDLRLQGGLRGLLHLRLQPDLLRGGAVRPPD